MRIPENRYCDPHCSWLRVAIWEAYIITRTITMGMSFLFARWR